MRLINPSLFNPRDVALIALFSIIAHAVARPLYKAVNFQAPEEE